MGRIKLTEEQIRIAERVKNGQGASTQQAPSAYRGGRITLDQKQIQIASKYGLVNQDYAKNRQGTQTTVDDPLHKQYAAFMAYQNAVREAELAQIKMKPYLSGTKKTQNSAIGGKVSQQEYSRSPAMQAEYGTYENYLRGVTAARSASGRRLQPSASYVGTSTHTPPFISICCLYSAKYGEITSTSSPGSRIAVSARYMPRQLDAVTITSSFGTSCPKSSRHAVWIA